MISLNPMLFKNIPPVGSFKHFVFVHLCVCVFVFDDDAVDDVDDDDHLDDLVVGQDASLLLGNTPLHDLDDKYKIIFSRNSAASLTP